MEAYRNRDPIDERRRGVLAKLPMLVVSSAESKGVSPLISKSFAKEDALEFCHVLIQKGHKHISHVQLRGCGSMVTEVGSWGGVCMCVW